MLDSTGGGIVLRGVCKTQFCIVILGLWFGVFGVEAIAARPEVKITVSSPAEIKIRIDALTPGREWSFRNAYAGVLGLAERIEQFRALARKHGKLDLRGKDQAR